MGEAKTRGTPEERAAKAIEGQIAVKVLRQVVEENPDVAADPRQPKFLMTTETQSAVKAATEETNGEQVVETRTWVTGLDAKDDMEEQRRATQFVMVRALASGMIVQGVIDPLDLAVQYLIAKGMVKFSSSKPKLVVPDKRLILPPAAANGAG